MGFIMASSTFIHDCVLNIFTTFHPLLLDPKLLIPIPFPTSAPSTFKFIFW